MAVQLRFLGWDAPVLGKVRDYLVPTVPDGPVDLRGTLVVVPTRQAGRRLREALALLCGEHNTYLLPPRMVTPPSLVADGATDPVRRSLDVSAVWARLLLDIDPALYPGLFPKPPPRTFAWALNTGQLLQSLRRELFEQGRTVRDIVDSHGQVLEEARRWQDMASLESAYVTRYQEVTGEQEPEEEGLRAAASPIPPDGIGHIVVACVADPMPLALQALSQLSATIPTTVLIHAPEDLADMFDEWGRPSAARWRDDTIEIPDVDNALVLAGSPATEATCALRHIEEHGADAAVGILDSEVAPYLKAELEAAGLTAFDPNGFSLATTPLLHLLRAYRDLVSEGSYRSLATLLRNADVLDHLSASHGLPADALLEELDTFQNHYLPATATAMMERLRDGQFTDELPAGKLTTLCRAAEAVTQMVLAASREPMEARVRRFLQEVFAHRELDYGVPDDEIFRATAETVDEALQASARSSLRSLGFTDMEMLDVVLDNLGTARHVPQRTRNSIDLEGWLELPWNDAPYVIVTGMNEGRVPARLHNETFLPESLRKALGVRTNEDRYGRDVYLARSLIESRRTHGGVVLVAAKTTAAGDPLLPSRILFRCSDAELPGRALRLFGPSGDKRASVPSTISFRFRADAPLHGDAVSVTQTSVVQLRDYIRCPFRFYLKHVLKMESLDDRKRELDSLDFGSLAHYVLNAMAGDASMKDCADERLLRDYVDAQMDNWAAVRLGSSIPLNISIQLADVRARLTAAARLHARTVAEGWRIIGHEELFECTIGGLVVRGRVDRIDRHERTGEIRILDYKVSEQGKTPEQAHLASWRDSAPPFTRFLREGKSRRWIDLQLPLYASMMPEGLRGTGPVGVGYFNLPRDTDATQIVTWDGFDGELMADAYTCAEAAARGILGGVFWPPAERVDYEDFESTFPGGLGEATIEPGILTVGEEGTPCP